MKKELLKNIFIIIFIIFLLYFIYIYSGHLKISGFAIYGDSGTPACNLDVTENSDFNEDNTCIVFGDNGPRVISNNIILNCSGFSLIGPADGAFGIKTIANNTIIKKCNIDVFVSSLNFTGNNTQVIDTALTSSQTRDLYLDADKVATFLNVSFTESKVSLMTGSKLFVQYYVVVNVTDMNNNSVNGATVNIYNESSLASQVSGTTNSLGLAYFNVTDKVKRPAADGSDIDFIYNVNASSGGDFAQNASFNVTASFSYIIVRLQLSDSTPPNITLISPADSSSSTTTAYNFTFNVTDSSSISNCTLIFDNSAINFLSTITRNVENGMYNSSLAVASHAWSINCTDSANNMANSTTRSLTINSVSAPPPGNGGGGGCTSSSWICNSWSSCINGNQTRTCISNCNTTKTETQNCSVCANECKAEDYPKCSKNNLVSCILENNCYKLKTKECINSTCRDGKCVIEEKQEPEKISNVLDYVKSPSTIIPHGKIPDKLVDATAYTGTGIIIIYAFNWLWLWLLTLIIPFFLLRLKHYCVALITETKIPENEIEAMALKLAEKFGDKIYLAEKSGIYKFIFQNSGFLEIQAENGTIINAHFSSQKKAEKFKLALGLTIDELAKQGKFPKELKHQILTTKESVSIISALRSISRKRKMLRMSRRFK